MFPVREDEPNYAKLHDPVVQEANRYEKPIELVPDGGQTADLRRALPVTYSTPTMSPYCADAEKYAVLDRIVARLVARHAAGEPLAGRTIKEVVTVNGARVILDNGSWGLVRASSNTPNLVVVVESPSSKDDMVAMFRDIEARLARHPEIGEFDQKVGERFSQPRHQLVSLTNLVGHRADK